MRSVGQIVKRGWAPGLPLPAWRATIASKAGCEDAGVFHGFSPPISISIG
jgi:hypothetical protein